MQSDIVVVGRIGAPHGVRGDVHVHSYTSPPDNMLSYRPWLCRRSKPASGEWQNLLCRDVRVHQDHFIAKVDGYGEREDVAQLRGYEIGVRRAQLPELDSEEHYWRDLMGCTVVSVQGQTLGRVAGLLETGVHDVLRVQRLEPGKKEILIPFVHAYVLEVSADQLTVDWDVEWME